MITDLSTNLEAELYQAAMAAMNQVLEKYQGPAIMSEDEQKQIILAAGNQLTTTNQNSQLATRDAEEEIDHNALKIFLALKSENTIKAYTSDLQRFADWLNTEVDKDGNRRFDIPDIEYEKGKFRTALFDDPYQWIEIKYRTVEKFQRFLIVSGYAISSINRMLSTIKRYAKVLNKAKFISGENYSSIKAIEGIGQRQKIEINKRRIATNTPTRRTHYIDKDGKRQPASQKKASHVPLSDDQAQVLKLHHDLDKDQGVRDFVLMCLLLDHGLRCGELVSPSIEDIEEKLCIIVDDKDDSVKVSGIRAENINLSTGKMRFYRPKVDKVSNLTTMSPRLQQALRLYRDRGLMPKTGNILRASVKGGRLTTQGMSERAITYRVRKLGEKLLGIPNLSAHDCRHYWATAYVENMRKTGQVPDLEKLQKAGGWASFAMPLHYINSVYDPTENWPWLETLNSKYRNA